MSFKKLNDKNLLLRKSRNGLGVFANKDFRKSSIITEVIGKMISCDEDDDTDEETRSNAYRFNSDLYISPEGETADFVNHSCNPNSKIVKKNKKLFIVAMRSIKKGEEILFDYSTIIASDDVWDMKCNCGESICRGVIKRFKNLPKKIKERYISEKIVPSYILRLV